MACISVYVGIPGVSKLRPTEKLSPMTSYGFLLLILGGPSFTENLARRPASGK